MTASSDVLGERLRQAVSRHLPRVTLVSSRPLPGGHSGHTVLARLDGPAVPELAVVKCAAPGRPPVGRHDVLRQARALAALAGVPGVHVPQVLLTDPGDPPLFMMAYAPGEAVEPVLEGNGLADPRLVEARARRAARMLRALHEADLQRTGLASEPAATLGDEVARWSKTMSVVDRDLVHGGEALRAGLLARPPRGGPVAVVHGDYRLGNILFDGSSPSGIVDWEIWSVTDPRIDLGWFLINCDYPTYALVGAAAPGMPSTAELLAEYAGPGPAVADVPWFLAFARFKMAAIMAHNLRRHREGRHHDPFQEKLPPTITALIERGLDALAGRESADG